MVELNAQNQSSDKLIGQQHDTETPNNYNLERVGAYRYQWLDGEDSFDGAAQQFGDLTAASESNSKVGRRANQKLGVSAGYDEEQTQPLIESDALQIHDLPAVEYQWRCAIAHNQPEFLQQQSRSFFETCCCCCIRPSLRNTSLTNYELRQYENFKREMVESFQPDTASHEPVLRALFELVFDEDTKIKADEKNRTEAWTTIGFQNRDPRSDFRAGGILSLLCLVYLVRYYPRQFEQIRKESAEKEDFWIAISSINLTSHLMSYLHMNTGKNMPADHDRRAGRFQFKIFAQLNSLTKQTFFVLQAQSFLHLYHSWRRTANTRASGGLPPNFQAFLRQTMTMVNTTLSDKTIISCADLQRRLEAQVAQVYQPSLV